MHLGATAAALERDGVPTRRGDHNRAVANDNDASERLEAKKARVRRYAGELLRGHARRRDEHQEREPGRLMAVLPGRRKAWEKVRDAIQKRIDRLAAQLDQIEAYDRRYGNADWASDQAGAGERLAHRKAAAVLPELAAAYLPARLAVIQQQIAEAELEKARVAQQRRDQGRGRGR